MEAKVSPVNEQDMAQIASTGMIFVSSVGGICHSPSLDYS